MQELFLKKEDFKYINLYANLKDFDDFALIGLCKTAVDNQVGSISVKDDYVENVWKWLELSDVSLNSIVNNFDGNMSLDEVFKRIKTSCNRGADAIEVFVPPFFFDVDIENISSKMDECLQAIAEAKGVKKVKISCESSFLKTPSNLKGIVYLLSKYKIDYLKTASGLYSSNSTINHLNAIMEEEKSTPSLGVDFLFDNHLSSAFVIDDSIRLAGSLLGQDRLDAKQFMVSCFVKDFNTLLGKSTC
ncbi:MAG: hypothetical protein IJ638_02875 [Alphaproteobacteria bacterium]|nr:hypothetical protein [Alphaproteobacteria bacterium]